MVGAQSSSSPVVRVAAVGDLHCTRHSQGALQTLFSQVSDAADILLLAGDLTDTGLADEARVLARELATLHVMHLQLSIFFEKNVRVARLDVFHWVEAGSRDLRRTSAPRGCSG